MLVMRVHSLLTLCLNTKTYLQDCCYQLQSGHMLRVLPVLVRLLHALLHSNCHYNSACCRASTAAPMLSRQWTVGSPMRSLKFGCMQVQASEDAVLSTHAVNMQVR